MSAWFDGPVANTDHPMSSVAAAAHILSQLPEDNALKSLEEITAWIVSVTQATAGFTPALRTALIKLLDEAGRPLHGKLMQEYLASPHLQDFQGIHLWKALHSHHEAIIPAYVACIDLPDRDSSPSSAVLAEWVLLSVRLLHHAMTQLKLELFRYLDVSPLLWEQILRYYQFTEQHELADEMLHAYPDHTQYSSPRLELLRCILLQQAHTETLPPEQIEVAAQLSIRLATYCVLSRQPAAGGGFYVDLSRPRAPRRLHATMQASATTRYIDTQGVLDKMQEMLQQQAHPGLLDELRFGRISLSAAEQRVMTHLRLYWLGVHPQREEERHGVNTTVEVVHDFEPVFKLIARTAHPSAPTQAAAADWNRDPDIASETWGIHDISAGGLGGLIPKGTAPWVKIGDLCGIKTPESSHGWVALIHRLKTDAQGIVHVGFTLLSKHPLAVLLQVIDTNEPRALSKQLRHPALPALLLPDEHNTLLRATMILQHRPAHPGQRYALHLGQMFRHLTLSPAEDHSDDYLHYTCHWLED